MNNLNNSVAVDEVEDSARNNSDSDYGTVGMASEQNVAVKLPKKKSINILMVNGKR